MDKPNGPIQGICVNTLQLLKNKKYAILPAIDCDTSHHHRILSCKIRHYTITVPLGKAGLIYVKYPKAFLA